MNKEFQTPTPVAAQEDAARLRCKPAGRPRASDLEERTRNLIHTAGMLFLNHGYGNVSLESIAREAHVAVRTIYVKFGGKAGLLKAAIDANRDQFYALNDLENDTRPVPEVLLEFGLHFYNMITAPVAVRMQRMVIAEARTSPELAETFFNTGPRQTREMLARYFERPDIRVQLNDGINTALLPAFLLNCLIGDQFTRFLFDEHDALALEVSANVRQRLELFLHAALRDYQ